MYVSSNFDIQRDRCHVSKQWFHVIVDYSRSRGPSNFGDVVSQVSHSCLWLIHKKNLLSSTARTMHLWIVMLRTYVREYCNPDMCGRLPNERLQTLDSCTHGLMASLVWRHKMDMNGGMPDFLTLVGHGAHTHWCMSTTSTRAPHNMCCE